MVVLLEHIMQWSVHDAIAVKTNPQVILTSDASGSRGCDAFTCLSVMNKYLWRESTNEIIVR